VPGREQRGAPRPAIHHVAALAAIACVTAAAYANAPGAGHVSGSSALRRRLLDVYRTYPSDVPIVVAGADGEQVDSSRPVVRRHRSSE
jgi:hypothetical protein